MSHLLSRAARGVTVHKGPRYFTRIPTRIEKVHILNEHYSIGSKIFHWGMGFGILGCMGSIQLAMNAPKHEKGKYYHFHKSCGLLMAALIIPRIAMRLASTIPRHVPGPPLQAWVADASHYAMYGMMLYMPLSGILMGYYGGKGLPFFWTHFPGAQGDDKDPTVAKYAYKSHKLVGQAFEILVLSHIGAVGFHYFIRAENIFRRMNPLAKPLKLFK